jgi:hypothetical protein
MRFTELKKRYDWEPVCFDVSDILLLLNKAVMAELVVLYRGCPHWIGVACEYDRHRQMFGDQVFYVDDQEFTSLEDLITCALLDGQRFADLSERLIVIDTPEGDPKYYVDLVMKLRKECGKYAD